MGRRWPSTSEGGGTGENKQDHTMHCSPTHQNCEQIDTCHLRHPGCGILIRTDLARDVVDGSCISHPPWVLKRYTKSHLNLGPPESQLPFQTSYLPISSTPINHSQSLGSCILSSHFLHQHRERETNPEWTGRPSLRINLFSETTASRHPSEN